VRRVLPWLLGVLLLLSVAASGFLAKTLWGLQKDYRSLASQFVKVRQELTLAKKQIVAAPPSMGGAVTPAAAAEPEPAAPPPPTGSVEAVRVAYAPKFLALQAECEGQLSSFLAAAKAENAATKAKGGTVDVAALGAKYYIRVDGVRKGCDGRVESLLGQMQAELRSNRLPLDLVDDVRGEYEGMIVARQAEIMAKAP
jgi:hypothetical protein